MQGEPLYFGGVTSFEVVWEGFGEQDTAVVFGVLVGMEVPEGVVLAVCLEPCHGDLTAE